MVRDRCVVDQNIDASELPDYLLHHLPDIAGFRDITNHQDRFMPRLLDLIDNSLSAPFIHVHHSDLRPLRRKELDNGFAYVSPGSRDNGNFIL